MDERVPPQEFLAEDDRPELPTIDRTPVVQEAVDVMSLRDAAIDLDVAEDLDDPGRLQNLAERFTVDATTVRGLLADLPTRLEVQAMKREYNESMDRIIMANAQLVAGTLNPEKYVEVVEGEQRAVHQLRERLQASASPTEL